MPIDKPIFIVERTRGAYIAAVFRTDLLFNFSIFLQYVHLDFKVVDCLNTLIRRTITTVDCKLSCVPLDLKSVKLAVLPTQILQTTWICRLILD